MIHPLSRYLSAVLIGASALWLGACTTGLSGSDFARTQTRGEQAIRFATVLDVRGVQIDGTRSGIGAVVGTVIGAIAGAARSGHDNKSALLGTLGGVIGGVAGEGIEQLTTKKKGVEVTVQYDNNKITAITQEDDGTLFFAGQTVRVQEQGGILRVVPQINPLPTPSKP